jgi:[ribosomal protein S18]-alanine N-acetyltransferase
MLLYRAVEEMAPKWFARKQASMAHGLGKPSAEGAMTSGLVPGKKRVETPRNLCTSRAGSTPRGRPTRKEARMYSDQKQEVRVHIRWMIRRDMSEVLQIEKGSFEFPWLDEDFIRCLRQRNCIGMVAEHEDRVVGFMIYELHKNRIRVLNFAVADQYQRRGVGSQMVAKLIAKLSTQRRSRILLEVRETNLAAQLFFRENGFRAVSVLHNYYDDTPEDAYLMQFRYRADKAAALDTPNRITRLAG